MKTGIAIFLAFVSSFLFSRSQELRTEITEITDNGIYYSNSNGNLFVGLDYGESLDGNSWHDAEATGMIVYQTAAHGSFEVPVLLLSQQYPKMFFRTRVSESTIGTWIPYSGDIPRFVSYDYIDLDKIEYVSKFRSGSGHDYSDDYETCRSMKHYYHPHSSVPDWTSG